ncbi:MAG: hypothetical protein NC548_47525 [Lachnospiraceae bacterium]|nr:hypothetical protein [Lachnospiraceae bacterium]
MSIKYNTIELLVNENTSKKIAPAAVNSWYLVRKAYAVGFEGLVQAIYDNVPVDGIIIPNSSRYNSFKDLVEEFFFYVSFDRKLLKTLFRCLEYLLRFKSIYVIEEPVQIYKQYVFSWEELIEYSDHKDLNVLRDAWIKLSEDNLDDEEWLDLRYLYDTYIKPVKNDTGIY